MNHPHSHEFIIKELNEKIHNLENKLLSAENDRRMARQEFDDVLRRLGESKLIRKNLEDLIARLFSER